MTERTLCVVKPNAVKDNNIGAIIKMLEEAGLKVVGLKMAKLTAEKVEAFYAEHVEKPFFDGLKAFMTSGNVVAMVLEGDDAIARCRKVMGATNPENADEGTIRKLFAASMTENAVHGSDSPESAAREINFYFDQFSIL
ncbi:MAG: nucleoside-diphosphate kinase [Deltaproteobacteria bacterium]|nr:nucleoside-diphosphate kinase [Deltaproteobacteria bacterium]MBN2673310.1 nucleoside-diphosphate kinase [Deltaproteobacteria bacterium]